MSLVESKLRAFKKRSSDECSSSAVFSCFYFWKTRMTPIKLQTLKVLMSVTAIGLGLLVNPPAQAGLWSATDLGTLGGTISQVLGINDAGQVVERSYTAGDTATHAFY